MLTDIAKRNTVGQLKGPVTHRAILRVVDFVVYHLETFAQEYAGAPITNEKGLTQKLSLLLETQARLNGYPFIFAKEYMEDPERGNSPSVDIGVINVDGEMFIHSKWYSNEESFFSMEAKRLDVISGVREKEYLVGRWENDKYKDCGGIERFKKGIHGRNLYYSAIIGYVQRFDFDYWYKTINSWIEEFITGNNPSNIQWSNDDKLILDRKTTTTAIFLSKNSRKDGTIHLYHLWINLTS